MSSNKKTISLRVPDEIYGFLKVLANSENRSLNKQLLTIIEEWMAIQKQGEKESERGGFDNYNDFLRWVADAHPDSNIAYSGNWVSEDIDVTGFDFSYDTSGGSNHTINFTTGRPGNDKFIADMIKSNNYNTRFLFHKKEEDDD